MVAGGGGAWLLGVTRAESDMDFGGGPLVNAGEANFAVAKFDASAAQLWSKMFGTAGAQTLHSLASGVGDEIVLVGGFKGSINFGVGGMASAVGVDVFVAKLDTDGDILWNNRFGGSEDDDAPAATVDGAGNTILAGSVASAVDFGGGPVAHAGGRDAVVVKLDSSGDHLWTRSFGDARDQSITHIITDKDSNIFVSGLFEGTLDFGSSVLTSDDLDIFLAKLDPEGASIWAKRVDLRSAEWDDRSPTIAIDVSGGVFAIGHFVQSVDFGGGTIMAADPKQPSIYAVRLDASGGHVGSKGFGSTAWQYSGGGRRGSDRRRCPDRIVLWINGLRPGSADERGPVRYLSRQDPGAIGGGDPFHGRCSILSRVEDQGTRWNVV